MRGRSKRADGPTVSEYRYTKESRKNNPAVGLAKNNNVHGPTEYSAEIDPHGSPILLFKGREEAEKIEVETVQLHRHESIHPSAILDPVTIKNQPWMTSLEIRAHTMRPLSFMSMKTVGR